LLPPKTFFACSSSLKGSCKLSTNVGDFARFIGSLFFACSFLSKESWKFRSWRFSLASDSEASFFACLNSLKEKSASNLVQILGEISVASFEAYFFAWHSLFSREAAQV
jgi:hypothetical protein